LEDKLKHCSQDNRKLMKKVETLETENKTLREQLVQLQTLVARATNPLIVGGTARSLQLGSCLMVVVLCFGILFSNLLPYTAHLSSDASYATTGTVRSRALLSIDSPSTVWSNLKEFYHALLPQDLAPPITTRYYDNMYDFKPPNDNTTSTSERQTLPVVRTKA
jgi:cyclic AMP-responsive element-binding protein 3